MPLATKLPHWLSVDEFLAWCPEDNLVGQLVDGEPQAMAPANRSHGAIQNELGRLIGNHLAERSSPCSVIITPGVIPRALSKTNIRVPDLAVSCTAYEAE